MPSEPEDEESSHIHCPAVDSNQVERVRYHLWETSGVNKLRSSEKCAQLTRMTGPIIPFVTVKTTDQNLSFLFAAYHWIGSKVFLKLVSFPREETKCCMLRIEFLWCTANEEHQGADFRKQKYSQHLETHKIWRFIDRESQNTRQPRQSSEFYSVSISN